MRLFAPVAAVLVAMAVSSSGCKDRDPPVSPPFQIFVRVESAPGQKVTGATVARNSVALGTTGLDGRAMLTLAGVEGEITDVTVKCPDAFASPVSPTSIRLTRFADPTKLPEYSVTCPPVLRRVVVAVRAENGPNLPVVYQNRVVTRTDISCAAHVALEVAPGARFQVTLDTTDTRLRPPSPSKPFTAPPYDEILLFDQTFEVDRPKAGGPRAR